MNESHEQPLSPEQAIAYLRTEEFTIGEALHKKIDGSQGPQLVEEAKDALEAFSLATDIVEAMITGGTPRMPRDKA